MLTLGNKIIAGSFKAGASWEVGDVGISAFGIDEALNKRRYLNGQVISQAQFVEFTAMLKSRVSVYPNLATTEVNWQAEVTNSKLGQCGKFVIDDNAGTIRLPKVVNINGLQDLTVLGGIKAESLPNIKGGLVTINNNGDCSEDGSLTYVSGEGTTGKARVDTVGSTTGGIARIKLDASLSSSTYQDNAPVQQEAVQYPYFIQVATGVETSIDVTREIELNNPFSLLDCKYSEYELSNASWLLSNGQWNSGAVYQSVYDLLLQIYNGTVTKAGVSVKLSNETYADTDFVLNTTDTTFRLPLYTQRVLVEKKEPTDSNPTWYNLYSDGWCEQGGYISRTSQSANDVVLSKEMADTNYTITATPKGQAAGGNYDLQWITYINVSTSGFVLTNGSMNGNVYATGISWQVCGYCNLPLVSEYTEIKGLYFYVGETVQDANIIAAAGVLNDMTNIKNGVGYTNTGKETIVGWGMPDYSAGISGTFSSSYTAPANGLFVYFVAGLGQGGERDLYVNNARVGYLYNSSSNLGTTIRIIVSKGDIVTCSIYTGASYNFYPMKGAN